MGSMVLSQRHLCQKQGCFMELGCSCALIVDGVFVTGKMRLSEGSLSTASFLPLLVNGRC